MCALTCVGHSYFSYVYAGKNYICEYSCVGMIQAAITYYDIIKHILIHSTPHLLISELSIVRGF